MRQVSWRDYCSLSFQATFALLLPLVSSLHLHSRLSSVSEISAELHLYNQSLYHWFETSALGRQRPHRQAWASTPQYYAWTTHLCTLGSLSDSAIWERDRHLCSSGTLGRLEPCVWILLFPILIASLEGLGKAASLSCRQSLNDHYGASSDILAGRGTSRSPAWNTWSHVCCRYDSRRSCRYLCQSSSVDAFSSEIGLELQHFHRSLPVDLLPDLLPTNLVGRRQAPFLSLKKYVCDQQA